MARNFIQPGKVLTYTAPVGGVVSGAPVLIGDQLVIPLITADAGAQFEGQIEGVWNIAKAAPQVQAIGVVLYWDDGAKKVTTTAVGNRKCGTVARAAGNTDATCYVRLDGIATEAATEAAAGAAVAAAVATTNVGAGDAGKLFKLDAAGKLAGRVIETDGAALDAAVIALAKIRTVAVTIAAGQSVGTVALGAATWDAKTIGGIAVNSAAGALGAAVGYFKAAVAAGTLTVTSVDKDGAPQACTAEVVLGVSLDGR